MNILTFDTSFDKTYVTLGRDEKVLKNVVVNSTEHEYHSVFLIPEIIKVLKAENLTMQDISAFGINAGPGSFTGIRICNTVARVAAQQLDAMLVPVSSLHIISRLAGNGKNVLVLTNARKNKAYAGIYNGFDEIKAPFAVNLDDIDELLSNFDGEILTDSFMKAFLDEKFVESRNFEGKNDEFGKFLYEITVEKLKNGTKDDFHWAKAKPQYVQPPSITISKKAVVK